MLKSKKERIIPKLDSNFHESIFFLEIDFSKNRTKEVKEKLINYYIKAVDYYTSTNQKDFSLYFQTKLLTIMKGQDDHFEKTIQKKLKEEDHKNEIEEILNKEKDIESIQKETIDNELQKQKEQFLFNLSFRKKYRRLKRFNSLKITSNTKNKLAQKSLKISEKLDKKRSIDLTNINNILNGNNNKTSNTNLIFSKIDNSLIDFDKINTLLIIEYVKKLKQYTKLKMQYIDKKTEEYLNYIQTNNELNLLLDDLQDKDNEEAEAIKNQIKANKEEWELYDNKNGNNENENIIKSPVNLENISNLNKILDNIIKKQNEIIKENGKNEIFVK